MLIDKFVPDFMFYVLVLVNSLLSLFGVFSNLVLLFCLYKAGQVFDKSLLILLVHHSIILTLISIYALYKYSLTFFTQQLFDMVMSDCYILHEIPFIVLIAMSFCSFCLVCAERAYALRALNVNLRTSRLVLLLVFLWLYCVFIYAFLVYEMNRVTFQSTIVGYCMAYQIGKDSLTLVIVYIFGAMILFFPLPFALMYRLNAKLLHNYAFKQAELTLDQRTFLERNKHTMRMMAYSAPPCSLCYFSLVVFESIAETHLVDHSLSQSEQFRQMALIYIVMFLLPVSLCVALLPVSFIATNQALLDKLLRRSDNWADSVRASEQGGYNDNEFWKRARQRK